MKRNKDMADDAYDKLIALWLKKLEDGTITAAEQAHVLKYLDDCGCKPYAAPGSDTLRLMDKIAEIEEEKKKNKAVGDDEDPEDFINPFVNQKPI